MIPRFAPNTQATVKLPIIDDSAINSALSSARYCVMDASGHTLSAWTNISNLGNGGGLSVTIPGNLNILATGINPPNPNEPTERVSLSTPSSPTPAPTSAIREVRFELVLANGAIVGRSVFYIVGIEVNELRPLINSFQTYAQATFLGEQMPDLSFDWRNASQDDKKMALAEAYRKMLTFRYKDVFARQPTEYFEDSFFVFDRADSRIWRNHNLRIDDLTIEQWNKLPTQFIDSLCRAQLLAADDMLFSDATLSKRDSGIVSETTGESSTTYASGSNAKPLTTVISKRALAIIGRYIDRSVKIVRT